MNKKSVAINKNEYELIIKTIRNGFLDHRPNNRLATILTLQANLGLRISDVLALRLDDIVQDGERYRLDIKERKTGKKRLFTVMPQVYNYMLRYCLENSIQTSEKLFNISSRQVNKKLKEVIDFLEIDKQISSHSFRKFFITEIYKNNNYDIILCQKLLQHSSPNTTEKYIGISSKQVEQALSSHIHIIGE